LPIMLLLDGLYANGPVIEICHNNRWDYMIVLKDESLTSVWRKYNALQSLEPQNIFKMKWGNRKQMVFVILIHYWEISTGESSKN
ncbi:MAG: hypothetical protein DRH26_02430, partial [Deltaproteobacteria bacterium]